MNTYYTKQRNKQFDSFKASSLYCPKCKKATPARERLLLILPEGNFYDYFCQYCGTSTGNRTEKDIDTNKKIIV